MTRQMSGQSLFLRFSWPCAEERLLAGKIGQDDFIDMEQQVENGIKPEPDLLARCFPSAVMGLEKFARENDMEMWSFEAVAEFWRQHQGSGGDCAVRFGVVDSINTGCVSVIIEKELVQCLDRYQLKPKKGNEVLIHRSVIVKIGF